MVWVDGNVSSVPCKYSDRPRFSRSDNVNDCPTDSWSKQVPEASSDEKEVYGDP